MRVSLIIPVLDEEAILDRTLPLLAALPGVSETIVVDGGSRDRSLEIARRHARAIRAPRGRAFQMNAGAAIARGDILIFLHADSLLDADAVGRVVEACADPACAGGCFTQAVEAEGGLYRLIEQAAGFRARRLGFFFGDSGLFVRRESFESLGGFPPVPIMEDAEFSRGLGKRGRIELLGCRLRVSPRRWQRLGVVRTTLRNWLITAGWLLGVTPERLAGLYPPVR